GGGVDVELLLELPPGEEGGPGGVRRIEDAHPVLPVSREGEEPPLLLDEIEGVARRVGSDLEEAQEPRLAGVGHVPELQAARTVPEVDGEEVALERGRVETHHL